MDRPDLISFYRFCSSAVVVRIQLWAAVLPEGARATIGLAIRPLAGSSHRGPRNGAGKGCLTLSILLPTFYIVITGSLCYTMSLSALQIRYAPRVSGLGACEKPSGPSARMLQHFWELHARRPMHRDVRSYASNTVQLRLPDDSTVMLDVPEGSSILEVALDEGLDIPHDCKMGVCMNCAAKLVRECLMWV